jgi:hypothetical protein
LPNCRCGEYGLLKIGLIVGHPRGENALHSHQGGSFFGRWLSDPDNDQALQSR